MSFWNQLKAKSQEMQSQLQTKASQFKNKEFSQATMAMCALIAAADGKIDQTERSNLEVRQKPPAPAPAPGHSTP